MESVDYVIVINRLSDQSEERRKFEASEKPEFYMMTTYNTTEYKTNKAVKTYHYLTPKQILSGRIDGLNVREYYIMGRALRGLEPKLVNELMHRLFISTVKWG